MEILLTDSKLVRILQLAKQRILDKPLAPEDCSINDKINEILEKLPIGDDIIIKILK